MDPSNNVARYDDPYRHYQEPWNNSHVPGLHLYAPQASSVNTSVTAVDSVFNDGNRAPRDITRTPSPTPSEAKQLNSDGLLGGEDVENWRFWIRREWLWYYVALGVIVILTALLLIFHTQIVD
ncbi:hypothetical protein IW262DRAFT_1297892 [Armillaria fumosa]|nr:hypothetical protein IW262DRAFT_1297892 [Armillaria fumosa]